jgi:hypothetical protein
MSCTMLAILSWLDFRDLVTLIMVVLHDLDVNFEFNHHLSLKLQ